MPRSVLRIAFLHLAPLPGDLAHNRRLVEAAVARAADQGATWIVTPELCLTGYTFADRIGTDWILPQPDPWMTDMCRLVARRRVTLFLSHPERDRESGKLYNSLFVIDAEGTIVGRHRKIHTLRVGSEAWSTPGEQVAAVPVRPFNHIGMLICADAYGPEICQGLQAQGAELLVSAAAWAPGHHGPNGEWERCTSDTGLPLLVCNRTGPDRTLDFTKAETVVVQDGRRLLSLSSDRSAIFIIDWDLQTQTLARQEYQTVSL
ncbi:MAG: carbon-nitrogen hydrolase family protein [Nitrospira sp.]|nr:carbon-nitrogen hydrolase family protein [Nitrospira sp.]